MNHDCDPIPRHETSLRRVVRVVLTLASGLAVGLTAAEDVAQFPVIDGREALAVANGEPIAVDAFFHELAALHQTVENPDSPRARQRPAELLDRLINIRLVLQEARNIGLDELPQVRKALETYRDDALKQLLYRRQTQGIEVAPEETEAKYREAVKELKIRSILTGTEEAASDLVARTREGEDFETVASELVEAGTAKIGDDSVFLKASEMLPSVREALSAMKNGEVSSPIKIGEEFAVVQLLEVSFPDDPQTRQRLEREVLQRKRTDALREYTESLREKFVKLNDKLFDSLDYEAPEPGFDALMEDKRVLAEIEGEEPLRVEDLTRVIRQEFFHGIEGAIEAKRVNARKVPQLDRLLRSKVVLHEARRLGLDRTEEYLKSVEDHENGVLFQAFIERIVEPEIRLNEAEMREYLSEHAEEFSSPAMMRIDGLVFDDREGAESVLVQLREGADFRWVRANADGQVDPGREGLVQFPDGLVVTSLFPEDIREVVAGASAGEFRLYAPAEGPFYVLRIREVVAPVVQPFEEVKQTVVRRLYARKRQEAVDDWVAKLRAASEVEVFATPEALERLLGGMLAGGT